MDAVLSECLQRECNVSKETIANQLSKLSNNDLQEWMRADCRQCLPHDKRRKKENVEYIARRFAPGIVEEDDVGNVRHDVDDDDDDDDIFGCHSGTEETDYDEEDLYISDLMDSKDPIRGGLAMVLTPDERVYIKPFLILTEVWGYPNGTAFEKETHDSSFSPHGRLIQYITDRLMRTLSRLLTNSPVMLNDYRTNLKGAIGSFPMVIESKEARAFIDRFMYHQVRDENMYQLTERLADYKVGNRNSFLMASIVGSARALLAIQTGDRTGVDMLRVLKLRIDEMDNDDE